MCMDIDMNIGDRLPGGVWDILYGTEISIVKYMSTTSLNLELGTKIENFTL